MLCMLVTSHALCMLCMLCLQEQNRLQQNETARLSSERDAALNKLEEAEENVFTLQQTVEV